MRAWSSRLNRGSSQQPTRSSLIPMVGPSAARMAHAERTPNTPSRSPTTARSYSPRAGTSPAPALRFRVHSLHGAGVGCRWGDDNLGQVTFTARNRPPTPYTSGVGIAVTACLPGQPCEQFRPPVTSAHTLLFVAPGGNRRVVSGEQNGRDIQPSPAGRFCVARIFQQAVFVGFFDETIGVANDSGNKPSDRLDHGHNGNLTPIEHIVTEADRAHPHSSCVVIGHPLVDSLVPTAGEDEVLFGRELMGVGLRKDLTHGRGNDKNGGGCCEARFSTGENMVQGLPPRLGLHDHPGTATVGSVVNRAVPVMSEVAQIVGGNRENTRIPCFTQQ